MIKNNFPFQPSKQQAPVNSVNCLSLSGEVIRDSLKMVASLIINILINTPTNTPINFLISIKTKETSSLPSNLPFPSRQPLTQVRLLIYRLLSKGSQLSDNTAKEAFNLKISALIIVNKHPKSECNQLFA
jgi:hypothetical protein